MNRKLDVGGTLSQAFSTYGAQAGVLLPVAFCLFLAVGVVTWAVAGSLIGFPIAMAVSIVAGTLYQGMVVGLVSDVQDGRRDSSVGDLMRATAPVVLPLIGAGLLAGLAIGIGHAAPPPAAPPPHAAPPPSTPPPPPPGPTA